MGLDNLKKYVDDLGADYSVIFCSKKEGENYELSISSPANLYKEDDKYFIRILNNLDEENEIQAIAHELGHVICDYRGMISFDNIYKEPIGYLKQRLENSLQHENIVKLLKYEFDIDSNLHINQYYDYLKYIEGDIKNLENDDENIPILHGIGLDLFDIARINPKLESTIVKILNINENVKLAYEYANEYLQDIDIDTPKYKQINKIKMFFKKLNYQVNKIF